VVRQFDFDASQHTVGALTEHSVGRRFEHLNVPGSELPHNPVPSLTPLCSHRPIPGSSDHQKKRSR
jgi:hypothetical protein